MNIVYFGTDVFIKTFRYFLENHFVLALYTYYNQEDYFSERNIVRIAHMNAIPVHYGEITEERMRQYVTDQNCELFFAAEYCSRLPVPEGLEGFKAVNAHCSLLPEGRSYYPIECAMAKGINHMGVTIHKISDHIDCGDILMQHAFQILPEDDSVDIYLKCAAAVKEMTEELMARFSAYWDNAIPQQRKMPYWRKPYDEKLMITHEMKVDEARGIYRCYNKMTKIKIEEQVFYIDTFMTGNMPVGTTDQDIIIMNDNRIIYGLCDGNIRIGIEAIN